MHRFLLIVLLPAAGSAAPLKLTLDDVPARVGSHNPELKAARVAIDEARARLLGSGRLSNPSLDFQFQNESRVSPQSATFALSQSFPLTRRLSLEKQLSATQVRSAELEVLDVQRRIIATASTLAVQIIALDQQQTLRSRQIELAEELATFISGRAEVGELSPLDASQAVVDARKQALDVRWMKTEQLALIGRLKPLLGLNDSNDFTLSGNLPPLVIPQWDSWTKRPDYRLAENRIQAAGTAFELARARRWEDVSAEFFTAREKQDTTPTNTQRTGFVGFRISIPLPLWNKNQGEIQESAAQQERARFEQEALGNSISNEIASAKIQMHALAELARESSEKLLPLAAEQTRQIQKAYEEGQADLLSLLRSREQQLQIESAALESVRDFHLARVAYEAAIGLHTPHHLTEPQPTAP